MIEMELVRHAYIGFVNQTNNLTYFEATLSSNVFAVKTLLNNNRLQKDTISAKNRLHVVFM